MMRGLTGVNSGRDLAANLISDYVEPRREGARPSRQTKPVTSGLRAVRRLPALVCRGGLSPDPVQIRTAQTEYDLILLGGAR